MERERELWREERGRPLREVQLVENLQACQFQLVHSGLWTQHFYFPRPLRERQMFSLSALRLKLCSRPLEVSQWTDQPSRRLTFLKTYSLYVEQNKRRQEQLTREA